MASTSFVPSSKTMSSSSISTPSSSSSTNVPVIIFPTSVDFYLGDPSTHKRVLTVYNPCEDTSLTYKVLSNNPSFYAVVEPLGTIHPQRCQDIVLRHVAVESPVALNKVDKFRVVISNAADIVLGKRDIMATLHPGIPEGDNGSSSLPHGTQHKNRQQNEQPLQQLLSSSNDRRSHSNRDTLSVNQPNYVACLAAVICIAALFLPTEGEETSLKDYPFLILSVNEKMVCTYVLGLVTMAILRGA